MRLHNSITDVENLLVGQSQNFKALTGCTVILTPQGATAGISQRGGAPGTRETDLLRPMHLIEKIHSILLTGGSAFGLDAAGGVMRWLEEKKIGFQTGNAIVPIVPAAVIYDLDLGNPEIRPNAEMGYKACENAVSSKPDEGNFGAGAGASVGKIFGINQAVKSGIGTSSRKFGKDAVIGAIAVVNAFGDILGEDSRTIIAGVRKHDISLSLNHSNGIFADTLSVMNSSFGKSILSLSTKKNTVIGVIATNVKLTKEEACKFAESASDGITLSVRPAFTLLDGDTVFGLSTGNRKLDINIIFAYAPLIFADAIRNAVIAAQPAGGLPSASSFKSKG